MAYLKCLIFFWKKIQIFLTYMGFQPSRVWSRSDPFTPRSHLHTIGWVNQNCQLLANIFWDGLLLQISHKTEAIDLLWSTETHISGNNSKWGCTETVDINKNDQEQRRKILLLLYNQMFKKSPSKMRFGVGLDCHWHNNHNVK